jgi:hypothetical protein
VLSGVAGVDSKSLVPRMKMPAHGQTVIATVRGFDRTLVTRRSRAAAGAVQNPYPHPRNLYPSIRFCWTTTSSFKSRSENRVSSTK